MKFSPILVSAFALFAFATAGCGVKSAKEAADEGRKLDAEAAAINNDLAQNHKVVCYAKDARNSDVEAYARSFNWAAKTPAERQTIRQKLNQLAGKIDAIFKIDRRKDVKVSDPNGALQKARNNVDVYLQSLDACERNGTCKAS